MKKYFLILFLFCSTNSFGQGGIWTWMTGSTSGMPAVYGTQGIPSIANTPQGIYEAIQWKDKNGNFWIYGGISDSGGVSDLWRFNPSTYEWTWVFGKGIYGEAVHYGAQGIPDTANTPGTRAYGAMSWVDTSGNFWLYGGYAFYYDSLVGNNVPGQPNDLWKYDPQTNMWTWVNGINVWTSAFFNWYPPDSSGPGSLTENNATWTDSNNHLWLFGGDGIINTTDAMWKYDISSDTWSLMSGTYSSDATASYGVIGVPSPTNTPGGRCVYSKWVDEFENFWIYGGSDQLGTGNDYADMWKYDPAINQWTWMSGSTGINYNGFYTSACTSATNLWPQARFENKASWTDIYGNLWFFGGTHGSGIFCDLWTYNPYTSIWTLVDRPNYLNVSTIFGTRGIASPLNRFGSRMGSVAWCDYNNTFWLFGGWGVNFKHNDLFKLVVDTGCYHPSTLLSSFSSTSNNFCQGSCSSFLNLSILATSYQWFFPGAIPDSSTAVDPPNICYPTPGIYDVQLIATNTNGSDTLLLTNYITVYPTPPPQSITQSGDTLFAIAGTGTYQWYFNNNIINGATDSYYVAAASGDYNVVCTDLNGCEVEAAIFNVTAGLTPALSKGEGVTVFPNPVGDQLRIEDSGLTMGAAVEISVYNMLGENIQCAFDRQLLTVDCRLLPTGMYWLEVSSSEKTYRTKFLKQ